MLRKKADPIRQLIVTLSHNLEFDLHYYRTRLCFMLVMLIVLVLNSATSQAGTKLEDLLELSFDELINHEVVSPTKTEKSLLKAPGAVSVVTYEDIQRSSATTIPELLRQLPGVNVRWNPMVQTIDIRGFGSNPFTSRVLLMIDGVPYNSWNKGGFPQHPGFDFFNLNNVKHLEVVRGPGSALYGENAFSGVINIVTISGEELNKVFVQAGVGEKSGTVSLTAGERISDDASYLVTLRADKGQLPTELWRENNAYSDNYDLFIKGKLKNWQLSYYRKQDSFDGFEHHLNTPAFPAGSVFRSAEKIRQAVNIVSAQHNYLSADDRYSSQSNISFANRNGSHCGSCHEVTGSPSFRKTEDHGYQFFANTQLGLHSIKNHDIVVGGEFRQISSGDHDHEFSGSSGGAHSNQVTKYNKVAFYAQDSLQLTDDNWELTYGLRYDGETSPYLFDDNLFPRVALVGSLRDDLVMRIGWSKAARYPTFSELYQDVGFFTVQPPAPAAPIKVLSFVPNPDLKPEYIESFEIGFSYSLTQKSQLRLDLFRNKIEDSIIIAYPKIRYENHPNDAIIWGSELEYRVEFDRGLDAYVNWSYQKNSQRGNGVDTSGNGLSFDYAPKHKVNAGLTYQYSDTLAMNVEASWRDEYEVPTFWHNIVFRGQPQKPLDAYLYFNARLDITPLLAGKDSERPMKISLIGKNLFNEQPYETLVGSGARRTSGREYLLRFTYDWSL